MKKLQETKEEKWQFSSFAEMAGVIRRGENPVEVYLLLHGLGERGKRIFRKLSPILPANSIVIAPNGPFPLERKKEGRIDYGHSWYFYDKLERRYFINQDLAKFWLRDLLLIENPNKLPVTIIGFSQGGYLAPLVGREIKETKLIMGLACEFRTTLIHERPPFTMIGVHGEDDEIVTLKSSLHELNLLKEKGIDVDFHTVKNTKHEISSDMVTVIKTLLETYGKRSL